MIQGQLLRVEGWQASTDDYYTPPWIFERLEVEFAIDVAAPPGGIPWIPATHFFTQADDGLAQDWSGTIWCNPPYSRATPWVHRMIEHGDGIILLPIGGNQEWLSVLWASEARCALLPPDLEFVRPNQTEQRIMWRTALWAFGDECVEAIGRLGHVR